MATKNNKKTSKAGSKKSLAVKKAVVKKSVKKAVEVHVKSKQANSIKKVVEGKKTKRASKKEQVVEEVVIDRNISFATDNPVFSEYMNKNVGSHAIAIVENLNESSQTDDKLSAKLNIKVNEVRRMLNVLNTYSVTRYDINKDNKGWLTFKWYLDREKLKLLTETVAQNSSNGGMHLQENCNDFFFCKGCYESQKVIFPFDSAFESDFKCRECGKALQGMNREETQVMVYQNKA